MLPEIRQFILETERDLQALRERRWLEQIEREYNSTCYMYSLKLKRPLFSLTDCETTLGSWDPVSKELRISKTLIENEPWSTVIGVIKHEMAHQVALELLDGKRDHDTAFRDACARLGLQSPFNRAKIDIAMLRSGRAETENENEQIVRKIERLLSLAKSDNENEAYSAMERAQKLMREYNISTNLEQNRQNFVTQTIRTGKKRIDRQTSMICSILTEHYFVRVIMASEYCASSMENFKTVEILGTKANVAVAEYVFDYLLRSTERLWLDFRDGKELSRAFKSSYQEGLLTGFRRKLERIEPREYNEGHQNKNDTNALVKAGKDLESFVKTQYPKLSIHKTGRGKFDSGAYRHGCSDGEKIVIHRGVSGNSSTSRPPRQLPSG